MTNLDIFVTEIQKIITYLFFMTLIQKIIYLKAKLLTYK